MEDYFFETPSEDSKEKKVYVLIIYDIIENKKRTKLAKFLQGYGFRIQKSAFEAMLVPSFFALTTPFLFTVAICLSMEVHRIFNLVPTSLSCAVFPVVRFNLVLESFAFSTFILQGILYVPILAVIVTVPFFLAVTRPLLLTAAILFALVPHFINHKSKNLVVK